MSNPRNRQPAGAPTGGQFSQTAKGSSGLDLADQQPDLIGGDRHGGYRFRRLEAATGRETEMYSATLTRDGRDVAEINQDGRGGQTLIHFHDGPNSPEAERFTEMSKQRAEVEAEAAGRGGEVPFEPEEGVLWDLVDVGKMNRKRSTPFVLEGDDFWGGGRSFRQASSKYTRADVIAELSKPEMAERNPRLWDKERGDFVPIDELDD